MNGVRRGTAALLGSLAWLCTSACHAPPSSPPPADGATPVALHEEHEEPARAVTGPQPAPAIVERYCKPEPGPGHESVTVMRDASGTIGGYVYSSGIMDSPVMYLNPEGKQVAMFHIFGSDQEKQQNGPIIEALRKAYPEQTALVCPKR